MANTWLNCVVRKDLNLPDGLLAAQVAHISDQWMREKIINGESFTEEEISWMKKPYINILAVNTLDELRDIKDEANKAGLDPVVWQDLVQSDVLKKNLPNVFVGLSIGPADFDKLKSVTGNLPRY